MEEHYLLSEAKAKFGEMIRAAKAGASVVLIERGKPIYRLVPYEKSSDAAARLDELADGGGVVSQNLELTRLKPEKRIEGAVERFLKDRDE